MSDSEGEAGYVDVDLSSIQRPNGGEKRKRKEKERVPEQRTEKRLRNNESAPVDRSLKVSMGTNEAYERQKLVQKILSWARAFPEIVQPMLNGFNLNGADEDDLTIKLNEIKMTVGSISESMSFGMGAEAGLILIEFVGKKIGLNLDGLRGLATEKEFAKAFKEWSLENIDFNYSKPQYRMLMMVLRAGYMLHTRPAPQVQEVPLPTSNEQPAIAPQANQPITEEATFEQADAELRRMFEEAEKGKQKT